jgi:hypothetical protein
MLNEVEGDEVPSRFVYLNSAYIKYLLYREDFEKLEIFWSTITFAKQSENIN